MRCNLATLLAIAACLGLVSAASAAPFSNGSFETGTNPGAFSSLNSGDNTTITGWTVGGGATNGIDYIGSYWQASNGSRSIDLNGTNLNTNSSVGTISQTFDTINGVAYSVQFDISGNPAGAPTNKTLTVSAGGPSQGYSFAIGANSLANMMWQTNTFNFVATSSTTTLTFASTTLNSNFGPALDNVRVTAVPEPATLSLWMVMAGVATVAARRRQRKS